MATLVGALDGRDFLLGDRFTAADVALGAVVSVGLFTKQLPEHPALLAYNGRLAARPAYQKAMAINWPPELFPQPARVRGHEHWQATSRR